MRVLLRLRRAQLREAVVGQHLGEDARERERRERLRDREGAVVLRHGDGLDAGPLHREAVEGGQRECADDLAHPVAAIVEEEDAVAFLERRHRPPIAVVHQRPHELVGLAALVGGLHREHRMLHRDADPMRDGVVRGLRALPATVAVHAVVAAGERRDVHPIPGDASHVEQQRAHHLGAERRRAVAAVEETVNGDPGHAKPHAQLDAREQVPVERMHATRAEEADEVQRAARLPQVRAEFEERRQGVEVAALDGLGDADEVLRHHAAGAQVEVPDFAVAHLSFGKPDGEFARVEQRARMSAPQCLPVGRAGQCDRVSLAFRTIAPAVEHAQHDWAFASEGV